MKQKLLLLTAVLLFGLALVSFSNSALDAKGYPCFCIEGFNTPPCPDNHTKAGVVHYFSECRGDCYTSFALKCRCSCCGAISYVPFTESVPCEDCNDGPGDL